MWLPTRGEKQQHKNNSAGPSSYCIQIHKKSETLTDDMMSYWVITMAEKLDVNAFKTCEYLIIIINTTIISHLHKIVPII